MTKLRKWDTMRVGCDDSMTVIYLAKSDISTICPTAS